MYKNLPIEWRDRINDVIWLALLGGIGFLCYAAAQQSTGSVQAVLGLIGFVAGAFAFLIAIKYLIWGIVPLMGYFAMQSGVEFQQVLMFVALVLGSALLLWVLVQIVQLIFDVVPEVVWYLLMLVGWLTSIVAGVYYGSIYLQRMVDSFIYGFVADAITAFGGQLPPDVADGIGSTITVTVGLGYVVMTAYTFYQMTAGKHISS